jgi:Ice-binding-like
VLLCAAVAVCPLAAKTNSPPTLQPVNLGSAATFAVFGGSGVTCTGASIITGDLGVYPIAGTAVTGFFTDDGGAGPCTVVGNIQDNDTFPETTAAQHAAASLTIAIKDAKGRTGAFTGVGPGSSMPDLGGTTLTPGLYTSKSTLAITGDVTLNGAGVYIFQIKTGLTVSSTSKVILAGGATAANVFWQVGTLASLGSTVAFQGNILAGAGVTMISGTTLAGRALSQTNVTFDTNTVTLP